MIKQTDKNKTHFLLFDTNEDRKEALGANVLRKLINFELILIKV